MNSLKPKPNWKKIHGPLGVGGDWYRWGEVTVCVANPETEGGWHISVSHPRRYPTWEEIKSTWYDLVPDADQITGAILFPPQREYVNIHANCFHVYQLSDQEISNRMKLDVIESAK